MALVAQWQSTGGHNQLYWVIFPAIASSYFFLFVIYLTEVVSIMSSSLSPCIVSFVVS